MRSIARDRYAGDLDSLDWILGFSVVTGALSGILVLALTAAVVTWCGRWIGGRATNMETFAALAWSHVITVWFSLFWIVQLLIYGHELFTSETPRIDADPTLAFGLTAFRVIETIGAIWQLIVLLICLGEAQGFSVWKALLNLLITCFLFLLPALVIAGLFALAN